MTAAVLWKEFRDQRGVWLTLLVVAVLGVVGTAWVFAPEGLQGHRELRDGLGVAVLVMGWTYGLVCGGMLLAGESENRTLAFLDSLPVPRLYLWRRKLAAGLLLVLTQALALAGLGLWLGLATTPWEVALEGALLLCACLYGLGWGLLCSELVGNVLGVVAVAVLAQMSVVPLLVGVCSVVGVVVAFLVHAHEGEVVGPYVGMALAVVGPFAGSALLFGRPDRLRREAGWSGSVEQRGAFPWQVVLWLVLRQSGGLALMLGVGSVALGLLTPASPVVLWPAFSLFVGVLCGVAVFADEQMSGAWRFLGEQRLPLLRIWAYKSLLRAVQMALSCAVLLLPLVVVELSDESRWRPDAPDYFQRLFRSQLFGGLVPVGEFLVLWVLTGFAVGQLCGLLFRKPIVAIVAALGLSTLLAGVWVPSLLGGGLHFWEVLGLPALLLAGCALVLRPWASGRLNSAGGWVRVGLVAGLAVLWLGFNAWFRVAEVPVVAEPWPVEEYRASFPTPEENKAGMLVRGACAAVDRFTQAPERPTQLAFPGRLNVNATFLGQADEAVREGWPAGAQELGKWLDTVFADPNVKALAELPELPVGVVNDPRNLTFASLDPLLQPIRHLPILLAARGLQRQAEGDPEAMVGLLSTGLAFVRNVQNRAPALSLGVARFGERNLLVGVERWLEKLDGRPDLLKRVLEVLVQHQADLRDPSREQRWAAYLILLNSLENPEGWLLDNRRPDFSSLDAALVAFAWNTPWEQERHRRIARVACWRDQDMPVPPHWWPGLGLYLHWATPGWMPGPERRLVWLRATTLRVALRLYQAEQGKPADDLADLVPRYLKAVPADPFDSVPFRYRLSKGEKIEWPAPPGQGAPQAAGGGPWMPGTPGGPPVAVPPAHVRVVPAGQGILWSVGEDMVDNGGVKQGEVLEGRTGPGEDMIFLVPLAPRR